MKPTKRLSDLTTDRLTIVCDHCGKSRTRSVRALMHKHGDLGLPYIIHIENERSTCPDRRTVGAVNNYCPLRFEGLI